jgi:hypothetical protein
MLSIGRAGASKRRRLLLLLSVGGLPPSLRPSGACLALGTRVCCSLLTPSRVAPHRGCVSAEAQAKPSDKSWQTVNGLALWRQRALLGHGPPKRTQFARDGNDDLVGMFPSGAEMPGAFTQAYLGLPTDLLDRLGPLLQASLQLPADFGGVARGPGSCNEGTAGMAVARLRATALLTPLARRVFRRC